VKNTEEGQRPLWLVLEGGSGAKYRIEEAKYTVYRILL
jgi:hypothetical protein